MQMPTKKAKSSKPRDENGRYTAPAKAVVSRLGATEETPIPEKSGDKITRHGSTIHYS